MEDHELVMPEEWGRIAWEYSNASATESSRGTRAAAAYEHERDRRLAAWVSELQRALEHLADSLWRLRSTLELVQLELDPPETK